MSVANLNGVFNGLSGASGNLVFVQNGTQTIMRQRVIPRNPDTPAQVAVRARLKQSQKAYSTLTPTQLAAWRAYAASLNRPAGKRSKNASSRANNVFVGLASKFLQVTPAGTVPLTPPAAPFLGDGITVTATAGAAGAQAIAFSASGPNASSVKTELLFQALASGQRAPQMNRYRSQEFVAFTGAAGATQINVAPGWYAPAFRFVNTTTGQDTVIVPLPIIHVS